MHLHKQSYNRQYSLSKTLLDFESGHHFQPEGLTIQEQEILITKTKRTWLKNYRYFLASARTFVSKWEDVMREPGKYNGLRSICKILEITLINKQLLPR